ncbi:MULTISPECIES: HipA domain-containing protein [Aquirufa]|uniref:HipA domain-containing protein n=1 Tax=Aquirufa TaxID=2676247 RepID=UPI00103292D6|nr:MULTISPECIES: HipA domain-containing protein [Aquirufa]MDT8888180.1 HipA domain-containing protein [Aquirufa sp. LEPPI-3A]TBH69747.1 type II toxin-antitoxin system HipA family toxin [Aquirufa antheringensis]
MNIPLLSYCPSTLAEGHSSYCRSAIQRLFSNHKVHHVLPYDSPTSSDEVSGIFFENRTIMSISGVQEKFSLLLKKNKLRLAQPGESGHYLLKPIPTLGKNKHLMPANEHLTMQIAKQVFQIDTAENGIVFFQNGEMAYLTKRFDRDEAGLKRGKEDFAVLANRTPQTHGANYKYEGNYLELFQIMQQYVPAYATEAPKLFKIILFNYLFSNGDAHLKNFSLLETVDGDYILSPAYDLLNSQLHIADSDFALLGGLYPKAQYQGKLIHQFIHLGKMANIPEKMVERILEQMQANSTEIEMLIRRSFLEESAQKNYYQSYQGRLKRLKI